MKMHKRDKAAANKRIKDVLETAGRRMMGLRKGAAVRGGMPPQETGKGMSAEEFKKSVQSGKKSPSAMIVIVIYKEPQGYVARLWYKMFKGFRLSDKIFLPPRHWKKCGESSPKI